TTPQVVIVPDGLRHAIACAHCSNCKTGADNRCIPWIINNLYYTLSELTDPVNLLRLGRFEVTVEYAFLGMPDAHVFRKRNYLSNLIYIQIAASTVVVFQQRHDSSIPAS